MKNKKLTIEEIAGHLKDMLDGVKTLSDATLEEITDEVEATSDCIVIEKSEVISASKDMGLRNGKVGYYFLAVGDKLMNLEVPMRRFIKTSIEEAWSNEKPERFVSDARELAKMLTAAVKRGAHKTVAGTEIPAASAIGRAYPQISHGEIRIALPVA